MDIQPEDYQIVEQHKSEIHQLLLNEATTNHNAFPNGDIDELMVVLIYNKLIIAFTEQVIVPQISPMFQVNLTSAILNLKKMMHDSEYGVWISFNIKFGINGSYYFLFNYEDSLDTVVGTYDPQVYKDELKQWPRTSDNVPDWWKQKLKMK